MRRGSGTAGLGGAVTAVALAAAVGIAACGAGHRKAAVAKKGPAVTIDLWFMSQCPYAGDMFRELPAAMEAVAGRADLAIHAVVSRSPDGSGFLSLHGQGEVMADALLLCAADASPSPADTARFLACAADRQMILPMGWEECAAESSIPTEPVKSCTLGQRGDDLLAASAAGAAEKGISASPTVLVDGVPIAAVRDAASLAEAVCCALPPDGRPAACPDDPTCYNAEVALTIVTDQRCEACAGQVEGTIQTLALPFPLIDPEILDWSAAEAKAVLAAAGVDLLPAYVFPAAVKETGGFGAIEEFTYDSGQWTVLRPESVDSTFDPEAEICANGKDDTGDGKADCDDPACAQAIPCRPEQAGTLDLFVMARCPYGVEAIHASREAFAHFGGKLELRIHWIVTEVTPEEMAALGMPDLCAKAGGHAFCSIHGTGETEDSLRWICAQSKTTTEKLMSLYACVEAGEKIGMDLMGCAEAAGLDPAAIEECAAGDEGADLLSADASLGEALGMDASPSYLWNNNEVEYVAPAPAAIAGKACDVNPGLAGCDDLSGLPGAGGTAGDGKQCGQ